MTDELPATYEILSRVCLIQPVMGDLFDRKRKGLPPRDPDFMYNFPTDMITNGSPQENIELWALIQICSSLGCGVHRTTDKFFISQHPALLRLTR